MHAGGRAGTPALRLLIVAAAAAALVLLAAASSSTTPPAQAATAQQSILGGRTTNANVPWVAAILNRSGGSRYDRQFCGGSLISRNLVLTAAHCLVEDDGTVRPARTLSVYVGSRNLNATRRGREIKVRQVIAHEDYRVGEDGALFNDVAILRLSRRAPSSYKRIKLAAEGEAFIDSLAYIYGWGNTASVESGDRDFPRRLQGARIPIQPDSACIDGGDAEYDGDVMLCAGYEDGSPDTCGGDSGGPLAVKRDGKYVLVGVTSYGKPGCGSVGTYGVYAWVGSPILRQWIRDNAGI